MTLNKIKQILKNNGWVLYTIDGSHYHYKQKEKPLKVTIPIHRGSIPNRVIQSILAQAGIN